jgi:hypothetical protein
MGLGILPQLKKKNCTAFSVVSNARQPSPFAPSPLRLRVPTADKLPTPRVTSVLAPVTVLPVPLLLLLVWRPTSSPIYGETPPVPSIFPTCRCWSRQKGDCSFVPVAFPLICLGEIKLRVNRRRTTNSPSMTIFWQIRACTLKLRDLLHWRSCRHGGSRGGQRLKLKGVSWGRPSVRAGQKRAVLFGRTLFGESNCLRARRGYWQVSSSPVGARIQCW